MRTKILLIGMSALFTAAAFPPFKAGFLIYFSPLPLLFVLDKTSLRRAFLDGYIWGLIFNLAILYGVFWATIPGTFGMLAVISLLPALNCLAYRFISRRSRLLGFVSWPMIWVSWDYLRTLTELNFPWADYGYTQSYYLALIQPAEIFGIYGVSLMIHVVNILLYAGLTAGIKTGKQRIAFSMAIILPVLFMIYGWLRLPSASAEGKFRIALAQGNITRDIKWEANGDSISFDTYLQMTRQAAEQSADLVIWPETATPFYLLHQQKQLKRVQHIVDSTGVAILTGLPQYEAVGFREYIYFNAATLVKPLNDSLPVYEKIKLVPLSERIPFSGRFKKLREIRLGQADFSSGRQMTIFEIGGVKFATVICFESAFPGYCAEFCRRGAQFLVVITNDMWFGPSSVPYQHAQMSVFRAIENRVPVARCANTGVSMFVDRWGRTHDETRMYEQKLIVEAMAPETSTSIYNRIGDILPLFALAGTLLSIIAVAFLYRGKYNEIHEP